MAEKETKNNPKDLIEAVPEEIEKLEKEMEKTEKEEAKEGNKPEGSFHAGRPRRKRFDEMEKENVDAWAPKTSLGRDVKAGKVKDIDLVLLSKRKVMEPAIIDSLINLESDLLSIGQAKGKFGGGKRRAWRQTQKKTKEGNVVTFSCMAVVGDKHGRVGLGYGRAKETLPARSKAIRQAKLNLMKINLGFESQEEKGNEPHTIPFVVEGKCGSVRIKLIPAPRGTGLVVGDQCKKILRLAGIKDVYGVSKGHTRTTFNVAKACIDALTKTNKMEL